MLLLLLLSPQADAVVFLGNPQLGFRVDRPLGDYDDGTVGLDKVRVHHCDSSYTDYGVSETIDPVEGYSLQIAGGDHCGITWFWSSDMSIDGGGGAFTVEYTGNSVYVPIDDIELDPKQLTPWSVTSGTMSGYGPWIMPWVD